MSSILDNVGTVGRNVETMQMGRIPKTTLKYKTAGDNNDLQYCNNEIVLLKDISNILTYPQIIQKRIQALFMEIDKSIFLTWALRRVDC